MMVLFKLFVGLADLSSFNIFASSVSRGWIETSFFISMPTIDIIYIEKSF